jgi:hypothetical protein
MGRRYGQYYGEHVSRVVSATGTWAASATLADILLDRDLLITNITLQAHMTVTLAATAVADGPKRSLQNLTLVGDGFNFFALSGGTTQLGVLLALLNQFDAQANGIGGVLEVGSTTLDQFYTIHPGHNIHDKFDLSAIIPARALSNLAAKIICPAAAAIDSGANISAGTYTFEIDGVQGVPIDPNMLVPASYTQVFAHTATTGQYGQSFDIPTGYYVKRAVIMTVDNTGTTPLRSDLQVTGLQVRIVKDSKPIIQKSFIGTKYQNAVACGLSDDYQPGVLGAATTRPGYNGAGALPLGFAIVDFRKYFDPVRGLNMRYPGVQQGDMKLDMTIGVATGQTAIFWDMYAPPQTSWVGK